MKKVFIGVAIALLLTGSGYTLYSFFSKKTTQEAQQTQSSDRSSVSDVSKKELVQESTHKYFLVPSLDIARSRANRASMIAHMVSIIPDALIFADNNGNSLNGYVPVETPCDKKPIVRLTKNNPVDVIVFSKQCSGENYSCYDSNGSKEVSREFALNEQSTVCNDFKGTLVSLSTIQSQEQAVTAFSGKISYDDIVSKVADGLRVYAREHGNSFKGFSVKNFFMKELSSQDTQEVGDNFLTLTLSDCRSKMQVDVAPSGADFVVHMPFCEVPQYSACIDKDTPIDALYVSETDLVKQTYHCK